MPLADGPLNKKKHSTSCLYVTITDCNELIARILENDSSPLVRNGKCKKSRTSLNTTPGPQHTEAGLVLLENKVF